MSRLEVRNNFVHVDVLSIRNRYDMMRYDAMD